jgi:hypothetical protein
MKIEFSRQILEKMVKYQISSKSVQWELSCSMRTDMTKLTVSFLNFANAPYKVTYFPKQQQPAGLSNADAVFFCET